MPLGDLVDACTFCFRSLLSAVAKVTAEDLTRVGTKYFKPLFDPCVASSALLCNTSKAEDVKLGFERLAMLHRGRVTVLSSVVLPPESNSHFHTSAPPTCPHVGLDIKLILHMI